MTPIKRDKILDAEVYNSHKQKTPYHLTELGKLFGERMKDSGLIPVLFDAPYGVLEKAPEKIPLGDVCGIVFGGVVYQDRGIVECKIDFAQTEKGLILHQLKAAGVKLKFRFATSAELRGTEIEDKSYLLPTAIHYVSVTGDY